MAVMNGAMCVVHIYLLRAVLRDCCSFVKAVVLVLPSTGEVGRATGVSSVSSGGILASGPH